jgi:Flp pilus assembly protein TadD
VVLSHRRYIRLLANCPVMIDFREMREAALRGIDARLACEPQNLNLRFERARMLDELGRSPEALAAYEDVLDRDAMHFDAFNNLATLQYKTGQQRNARISYQTLVTRHPGNPIAHANLGFVLLKNNELPAAREHYARALELDPDHTEAHKGLGLVLDMLGEKESAREHAQRGFRDAPVTSVPYRGTGRAPEVLAIVTFSAGNVHLQHYVTPDYFGMHKLVAEHFDVTGPLPAHDVVFNAVGDADICGPALDAVRTILERTGKPVINPPAIVAQTTRENNAFRLGLLDGVRAPLIVEFDRDVLTGSDGNMVLANMGFDFPLLLRAPGFHTGQHFERVEREADLVAAAARMPGDRVLAIEFIDVRGTDGMIRKYRAIFIDTAIEPLHLAISPDWKVHYFSADMTESEANRAEDQAFIDDLPAALGPRATAALESIRAALALDYGGIDFALDRDGRVVVFEANATMIVPVPKADARWDYRRAAVERIHSKVRTYITARAGLH